MEDYYCNYCKDEGKFYYKNKCYNECPLKRHLNNSNNECYLCSELNINNNYYQNGSCVEKCEEGFVPIKNNIDNIDDYYCYYCGDEGKFFENNKCVDNCSKGYGENISSYICEYCLNKTDYQFYYEKQCVSKCEQYFGWDDNKICTNCSKEGLLFKENKCESTCGKYIQIGNIRCEACKNYSKYFFEYKCYKECPNYTIPKEDDGFYCKMCDNNYQDNSCVDSCYEGYSQTKETIPGTKIAVNVCEECGINNNSWYNGFECVPQCPETKYADNDDHFCRLCFCGFNNISNCSNITDECECEDNETEVFEIFGNNCEFYSNTKRKNKSLFIEPLSSVISSKKSIFSFNLSDSVINETINYTFSIKWRVFVDNSEILDIKNYATGVNEKKFIINSNLLQPSKNNTITLDLNITDINNLNNSLHLYDRLEIAIQSLDKNIPVTIRSAESINKVMNNSFLLITDFLYGVQPFKYYYQIFIKDEHNEIISIKNRTLLQPLINKKSLPISFMLPIFQVFIFQLSNNRGEKYNIPQENEKNENSYIKYSLEDIIEGDLKDDYSEIERIFVIMKYIDIKKRENKEKDINYDSIFDFIKQKLIAVSNENGYFEDEEKKQLNYGKDSKDASIRYYINYYEPKTIFSLLNKIFLIIGTNIKEKHLNSTLNILYEFLDKLIEIKCSNLDNSNILSFFRTFDHLIDIYINKEKSEQIKYKNTIFEILNKLSEFLITQTYPGETIRLVGKRISFFLSHFGEYQYNLSFASINNISNSLKYDNYSTFSFDDFNLNQENCDDEGNTFLCIKNDSYKEFKEKNSDNENCYLSFFSINNNIDNIFQNENEGNSFELKIINKNYLRNPYINKGFFYDIEFPFNYIPTSNNDIQINSQTNNNEEKDYSNITCIPKNNLYNKDLYCLTYFNYETNIIKCSCNIMDEITYISNYEIANFYKEIQYKMKIKSYEIFNKYSIFGVLGLLLFLFIPNFGYILYDIVNDIKIANHKLLSFSEKVKQNYLKIKSLSNSSILSFSIKCFIYKFPLLSPLRQCDFKSPKYIKHFIITLALSYGMVISLILFLFYTPFYERQIIINKRDIKNPNYELSNWDIYLKYFYIGVIFTIFGAIITRIIIYIFGIILNYNKNENKYWKNLKKMFSNYVNNYIKGEVLLGATWTKIKLRMIAYTNICGNYIINKKNKKNKNFENYISDSHSKKNYNNRLLPLDLEEEMVELNNENYLKSETYQIPSINSINNEPENFSKCLTNKKSSKKIWFSTGDLVINNSREQSLNKFLQVKNVDNFQLYSNKIKVKKSIINKNKFERIRNRYFFHKNNNLPYEKDIDSEFKPNYIQYKKNLEIVNENNISYLTMEEFIPNETLNKRISNRWRSSNLTINISPEGYWLLINISFLLTILLLVLICIVFLFIKLMLNEFGNFIINVWVACSIFIYILVYPLLYFLRIFIGSILVFKCYHLKDWIIFKPFFWIFVDKTLINIFKVRNYITKYKKELDY